MNDNEIWKQYLEFPFIEGSSLGRVRTQDRVVRDGKGKRIVKGRILKQHRNNCGYLMVGFWVNGKKVDRLVHRLVAQTFLPNPKNWPEVNHKDCNRTNNNVSNLEWCTHKYNANYREKYGVSMAEAQGQPIYAINLTTLEVSCFRSQNEASRALGINSGNVNSVLKGRYNQTGGFWFTNADDNAIGLIRNKFGDVVANKVEELMNDKETQLA